MSRETIFRVALRLMAEKKVSSVYMGIVWATALDSMVSIQKYHNIREYVKQAEWDVADDLKAAREFIEQKPEIYELMEKEFDKTGI